jgi:hypothetical protein
MDDDLTQQLLVGTWVGIAIVIEALVEEGLIKRKAILKSLSAAEAVRGDKSEEPLRVIQAMVRQGVIKSS